MQHRKTISLTSKDDAFISEQVASGEYGNASEVVRAGLRLLEHEQLRLAALRQAIVAGDDDARAGRTKVYGRGEVAGRLKARLGKQGPR